MSVVNQIEGTLQMVFPHEVRKPLSVGVISALIDRYYFRRQNMNSNLMYGFVVGLSEFLGDQVSKSYIPPSDFKSVETRGMELVTTLGGVYLLDKAMSSNILNSRDAFPRIVSILGTDIVVEELGKYMM
jgi:hypothetical protein